MEVKSVHAHHIPANNGVDQLTYSLCGMANKHFKSLSVVGIVLGLLTVEVVASRLLKSTSWNNGTDKNAMNMLFNSSLPHQDIQPKEKKSGCLKLSEACASTSKS